MQHRLIPKFVTVLQEGYQKKDLIHDLIAGVIVGIVALPMAIAFAIASGVRPEQGLYTAVIAGFLISLLSGSRVQIGGPTGAFIVIIYGIVQQFGYSGLAVATILAGGLLVTMGVAGLGSAIKFVPYPVTIGFTSGIALIIYTSQIRDFLGLQIQTLPAEFIDKWITYFENIDSVNLYAFGIGLISLLIIIFWPRVTHRIPGPLVAILVTTPLVSLFDLPVETIGARFGSVPHTLPAPHLPQIDWQIFPKLISPAVSIALLGGIESLLSAVVADGMTGRRHRSNMELVAQGIANIVSPIFAGIPATGAIARTATNIKNGGKSPLAGIVHAGTLLLIMLFFGSWAELIPLATLSAILIVVSYNMGEWHLFIRMFRGPKSDILVLLSTFWLTVLIDLVVAIQVGVVLASLLFMRQMSEVTQTGYMKKSLQEEEDREDPLSIRLRDVPEKVEVFEIYGPFFFGAADKFKDALNLVKPPPEILILRMRHVLALDATGLRALEDVFKKTRREGTTLVLSGVHSQPLVAMEQYGLIEMIGEENVHGHIDGALNRARQLLGLPLVPRNGY
ncbi:sulfate permease [bacterium]|nr:sulfate permease [bacterium]MBV6482865.1 C4-dicarboxylic acid transporter DauA [bacterium]MCK6495470.1 sulfate permease [bacterium]NUP93020.1 sulfate permease [Candidatus Omnitrophota bacterium]